MAAGRTVFNEGIPANQLQSIAFVQNNYMALSSEPENMSISTTLIVVGCSLDIHYRDNIREEYSHKTGRKAFSLT